MSERVHSRLKNHFGGRHIWVRAAAKVMAHLMFGIVALTVDQWLKLTGYRRSSAFRAEPSSLR
jgi:hypothetical protein